MKTLRCSLAVLTLLASSLGACPGHAVKVKLVTVPNTYRMIENPASLAVAPKCAGLSKLEVVDARDDTATVGEIFKEDDPSLRDSILLEGKLTEWVGKAVREVLETAAVSLDESGAPALDVRIARFKVVSKVAFNAEFRSMIVLDVVVRDAGTREICWESRTSGVGENYGSAKRAENYVEVMSQSADRALFSLLGDAGFVNALCECR